MLCGIQVSSFANEHDERHPGTGVYNKQQGEKTNPGETGCDEKEPVLS